MRHIVKSVVCDYGVYEKTDNEEKLIVICNSLSNAKLIADILNTDLKNTKYEVIERFKIDKAIEDIEKRSFDNEPLIIGECLKTYRDEVVAILKEI